MDDLELPRDRANLRLDELQWRGVGSFLQALTVYLLAESYRGSASKLEAIALEVKAIL